MKMESRNHLALKTGARLWLLNKGFIPCEEVNVAYWIGNPKNNWNARIDVVGFKGNEPMIGIECGNIIKHNSRAIARVFPILHWPFKCNKPHIYGLCEACKCNASDLPVHIYRFRINLRENISEAVTHFTTIDIKTRFEPTAVNDFELPSIIGLEGNNNKEGVK